MRCLYCGKELALLKRLTRSGQFCSEAHKKAYQDEYNRIGLSRLQQAKHRIAPVSASQGEASKSGGPGHEAPVVVEEAPVEVEEAPVVVEEVAVVEEETLLEEDVQESPTAVIADQQESSEEESAWEPSEIAGFMKEPMAAPVSAEVSAEVQPWERSANSPVPPEWRPKGEVEQAMPQAAMVELKFRPVLSDSEQCAPEVKVSPNEFAHGNASPSAAGAVLANRLASVGPMPQVIVPRASEYGAAASVDTVLSQPSEIEYRESVLLRLPLSQLAFLEEDADVILEGQVAGSDPASPVSEATPAADENILWPDLAHQRHDSDQAGEEEALADETPALAKLHEGIHEVEEQTRVVEQEAAPETVAPASVPQEPPPDPEPQSGVEQPVSLPTVEIPVKTFAPAKPAPAEGAGALIEIPVFLPRLTGLPLRPKMGLVASPTSGGSKKAVRPAAKPVQSTPQTKAAADAKQVVEPVKDDPADKPARRSTWSQPVGKTVTPSASPAEDGAPVGTAAASKLTAPSKPPKEGPKDKQAAEPSGAWSIPEKAADVTQRRAAPDAKTPEAGLAPAPFEAPSFGAAKTEQSSLMNSFAVKVAVAAALVVLCITIYLVFGGKSQAPAATGASAAADQPGPSIMVGSGGWVEGWAGDPAGAHNGRQITIYRPSLKLSDYRIDFKGEIETKSLGWVFRAADPEDYYAIKLAIVTPGLEPKIALLKYLVKQGHETQVGKVPVNLDVKLDTLYTVRVDVRGPKFTTYVQGQLIDTWIDDQLKSGGVGFLNEREERGRIKSVSVSLLNGGK